MKQIILGLLFVIGIMGETQAQERVVQKKVQDLVGTFSLQETNDTETLIGQVKTQKDWDVKVYTNTFSSPQVPINAFKKVENLSKTIYINVPENVERGKVKIFLSDDLAQGIQAEKISQIEKEITDTYLAKGKWSEAASETLKRILKLDWAIVPLTATFVPNQQLDNTGFMLNHFFCFDPNVKTNYLQANNLIVDQPILDQYELQFGQPVPWVSLSKNVNRIVDVNFNARPPKTRAVTYVNSAVNYFSSFHSAADASVNTNYKLHMKTNTELASNLLTATEVDVAVPAVSPNTPFAAFRVRSYPEKAKRIAFIKVNSPTAIVSPLSFNQAERDKYWKRAYSSANMTFRFFDIPDITLAYDLDGDNRLSEVFSDLETSNVMGAVNTAIENYFAIKHKDLTLNDINFIVIYVEGLFDRIDGATNDYGIAQGIGTSAKFVLISSGQHRIGARPKEAFLNTTIHEVGHLFGLHHPFDQFTGMGIGSDPPNAMDYRDGNLFRRYQWDIINSYAH